MEYGVCTTDLGWKTLLHIFLHPAQEEGLELLVEGGEGVGVALSVRTMSFLKSLPVRESPWHYEMEERPQLLERILEIEGESHLETERIFTLSVAPCISIT